MNCNLLILFVRHSLTFVGVFTGHDPTRGSEQEAFKTSRVEPGWVGLGRVGSGGAGNFAGRIAPGQEVFKSHGTRSGHPDSYHLTQSDPPEAVGPVISPDYFRW